MGIGASILLIAVGAILYFATNFEISGFEVETVGLILMVVGIIGLLITLFMLANQNRGRRTDVIEERTYRDVPPRDRDVY